MRLPTPDWLHHRLNITGAAAEVGRFREAVAGAGVEAADVDIDVGGLVADLLPRRDIAAALARHGRQATSAEQADAARRNGAKGGRPKSRSTHEEMSKT